MTALSTLLDAIRTDATLAWLLVHAPDGDADAAVRRAWKGETRSGTLLDYVRPRLGVNDYADVVGKTFHWTVTLGGHDCPACCDAIRAAVTCPTWAELTATKGREG